MSHNIDIIKDHYSEFIDKDNIVFSAVDQYIIIIKLLKDSKTDDNNIDRPDIINNLYACYNTK